ncbi:stonustoxin subunit beta-like [Seriola aureovittata]|uniref:stonustoxin subunit beta-like n=1 Tax=Seriola aureovittata TaxID=2871759 RepID=UPI0024BE6CA0|nr:stonustoxin subunit beta-like [Seriola aureovittata]
MSGHRGRLCFSGLSSELQPLPPERAGPELQSSRRLRTEASVCWTGGSRLETGHSQRTCWSDPPPPFRAEPGGVRWLTPGLRKYSCELTIDTNTVNRQIKLSHNNRKMRHVEEDQSYPDHPGRYDPWPQLMCSTSLTGRCYWEVEWSGNVEISVSYRGISRRGNRDECRFGENNQSWSLKISDALGNSVYHNKTKTSISSSVSDRVAVYVNCPAGSLSFYRVSSNKLIHLHTFNTTFTEPLYPGFGFWPLCLPGSSLSLC